jgi:hypothetical protein
MPKNMSYYVEFNTPQDASNYLFLKTDKIDYYTNEKRKAYSEYYYRHNTTGASLS